jgi:hypothetical protein
MVPLTLPVSSLFAKTLAEPVTPGVGMWSFQVHVTKLELGNEEVPITHPLQQAPFWRFPSLG